MLSDPGTDTSLLCDLFRLKCGHDREARERFLTVVLAELLCKSPRFREDWLAGALGGTHPAFRSHSLRVASERPVLVRAAGRRARQVDISLEANDLLVFIEAKLDRQDHQDQIRDYGSYLAAQPHQTRALIYLTRGGERPKYEPTEDFSDLLLPLSWSSIHEHLLGASGYLELATKALLEQLGLTYMRLPTLEQMKNITEIPSLLQNLEACLPTDLEFLAAAGGEAPTLGGADPLRAIQRRNFRREFFTIGYLGVEYVGLNPGIHLYAGFTLDIDRDPLLREQHLRLENRDPCQLRVDLVIDRDTHGENAARLEGHLQGKAQWIVQRDAYGEISWTTFVLHGSADEAGFADPSSGTEALPAPLGQHGLGWFQSALRQVLVAARDCSIPLTPL